MNILDQRSNMNWPLAVQGVAATTISVIMAGDNGLDAVSTGLPGTGVVTDAAGLSYTVKLPGSWVADTRNATFTRK